MSEDISKRTITILVILTVIISVLGTLSVMSSISDMRNSNTIQQRESQTSGKVGLRVQEPVEPASVTGHIGLEITQPENESNTNENDQQNQAMTQENSDYDIPLPE